MNVGYQLLLFAILTSICDTLCPFPDTLFDDKRYPVTWKDNGEKYILPFQHTICLTDEGKLVVRQCIENQWHPPRKDVPEFTIIVPELTFEGPTFIKYSVYNETFGKQGIFYTVKDFLSISETRYSTWYPYRRDYPDKIFYPHVNFMPGDDFGSIYPFEVEEDCLIIDKEGKNVNGVECSDTNQKTMMPIKLVENSLCPENSFSFSFEEHYCIGLDLEDAQPVTLKEFAVKGYDIYNAEWNSMKARILSSTTVPGADIVVDFSNAKPWTVVEGEELKAIPILTRKEIEKKDVFFGFHYISMNPHTLQIYCEHCDLLWKQSEKSFPFKCFTNANDQYIETVKVYSTSRSTSFEVDLHSQPGLAEYWCAGHSIFQLEEVSSMKFVVGFKSSFHEELVFFISVELEPGDNLNTVANRIRGKLGLRYEQFDKHGIIPPTFVTVEPSSTTTPDYSQIIWEDVIIYLRPFEIVRTNSSKNHNVLCHLITDTRYFVSIEQFSTKLSELFGSAFLGNIRSTEYCHQELLDSSIPEVFWKTVSLNQLSTLNSPKYLTADNMRPTRKCIGDFIYGAVFEPFDATSLILLTTTESLDEMLATMEMKTAKQIVEDLEFVVTNDKNDLIPLDYQYIGDILENVNTYNVTDGEETHVLSNMTDICNSLLDSAPCFDCENSTNVIISRIEEIIDDLVIRPEVVTTDDGLFGNTQNFFTFYAIDVSVTNISGLAFYRKYETGTSKQGSFFLKYLYKNTSFDNFEKIVNDNLEIATFFPENLLDYWKLDNDSRIVLKIYRNDNLFQIKRENFTKKVEFNITSISVPNYPIKDFGGNVVPLILRYQGKNPGCYYWDYESSCWSCDGVDSFNRTDEANLLYCNLTHLTPFTHLVDLIKGPNGKAFYDFWLDVITLTSSCLSMFGVLGIFLAMIILKKWRKTKSARILLHLTIATFIQILAFLIVSFYDFDDEYSLLTCATFGALLQYTLLVQFLWMMIIAISNWKFYKYPFHRSDPQSDREHCSTLTLLAWGFPLIPVLCVISYGFIESFKSSNFDYDICSPSAKAKLWGFAVPIYTILFTNFIFYILLFWEFMKIWKSKVPMNAKRKVLVPILRNLTILFFALGFPWIFGLLHIFCAELNYPNVFSYIFVITAPLQGFILFLYFVIFNPCVREEWSGYVMAAKRKTKEDQKMLDKIINFIALKISDFWYIIYVCVVVSLNLLEQMKS